jgi:hypothetical protein
MCDEPPTEETAEMVLPETGEFKISTGPGADSFANGEVPLPPAEKAETGACMDARPGPAPMRGIPRRRGEDGCL